jgi:hypothetical protein
MEGPVRMVPVEPSGQDSWARTKSILKLWSKCADEDIGYKASGGFRMAPTLQDALNFIEQGDKVAATGSLATIVKSDPNNEAAWLILSSVLDDSDKKRQCLGRVLAINPNNSQAALELMRLQPLMAASVQAKSQDVAPESPSVESVQCPKCGGPVSVESGRGSLHCSYCGAGLRITRGASGHAMATLDDIKSDTSVIAKEAVHRRLSEELITLTAKRDKVQAQQREALQGRGYRFDRVMLAIAGIVLVGLEIPLMLMLLSLHSEWGVQRLMVMAMPLVTLVSLSLIFMRSSKQIKRNGALMRECELQLGHLAACRRGNLGFPSIGQV